MPPRNPPPPVPSPAGEDPAPGPDTSPPGQAPRRRTEMVWGNVVWLVLLHVGALHGLCLLPSAGWKLWIWTLVLYTCSALGITAGSHRLWSHRSYKARLPLRILLAFFTCIASQNDIIEWARDHRVHHKYSETDADPHNVKRGFFFAHLGWLMVRKHPDVKTKGRNLDFSDLYNDPVCAYQRKIYWFAMPVCCYVLPAVIPWYYWDASLYYSFFIACVLRHVALLNATWCVNSVAHLWGNKPYDRNINPVENVFVSVGAVGEGFHNYHHTFPRDYSTSEHGWTATVNLTTAFIDLMARLGLAYDRVKMPYDVVFRRKQRTGDGSQSFGFIKHQDTLDSKSRDD